MATIKKHLTKKPSIVGKTVKQVKVQGDTMYITFEDECFIVLESAVVKQTLALEDNIALGRVSKEDIATLKRMKSLGVIPNE